MKDDVDKIPFVKPNTNCKKMYHKSEFIKALEYPEEVYGWILQVKNNGININLDNE